MRLKLPVLIINLKKYEEVLGDKPIKIAKIARRLSKKYKVTILVAPPHPFLNEIAKIIPTVSQHLDPCEPGAYTGSLIAKEIKELGIVGSLVNHSEKRVPYEDIRKCVEICRKYGLVSIVCAKDNEEAGELAKFEPDFIAVEPPELIGGNVSVSTARPEIIKSSVDAVRQVSPDTSVLCGAGVKTREDVKKAIELGAKGVLVASGVVKAPSIENAMKELIMGMK